MFLSSHNYLFNSHGIIRIITENDGNTLDVYTEDTWFETLPRYRLS